MIYIKRIILYMLILNLAIFANDIKIIGQTIKLLDTGKRIRYFNSHGEKISIHIPKKNNKLITNGTIYSKGGFEFKKSISNKYIGEELQFKINKNWFILSPFNGKFFLPKYSSKIKIIIIPKESQIYQELFKVIDYYTIQTFVTSSSKKAEYQLKNLRYFCERNTKKGSYYCKKYIKKIPIIEPNKDPLYKIYYNRYKSYDEAKRDLKLIQKLHYLEKSFIVQHSIIDTDFYHIR